MTEVLIFASDSIASKVVQCIRSLSSAVYTNLRHFGVIFDQSMYIHVSHIYETLPNLGLLYHSLSYNSRFYIITARLPQLPFRLPHQVIWEPSKNGPERCCKAVD